MENDMQHPLEESSQKFNERMFGNFLLVDDKD